MKRYPLAYFALAGCAGQADTASTAPDEPVPEVALDDTAAPWTGEASDGLYPTLEDLECASGETGCADAGPFIEGTCCAEGEALVQVGLGRSGEGVDVEVSGDLAVVCGGFGDRIHDISDPAAPVYLGATVGRCQRIAFGPTAPDGDRVLYLAHHGDGWVQTPGLYTSRVSAAGEVSLEHMLQEEGVLYEGLAWRDGLLYAAAHAGGLRLYETDDEGALTLISTVSGFENAGKLELEGDYLYVTDNDRLQILSLADPRAPEPAGAAELPSAATDVDAHGDRLYVALGGDGLAVFDRTDPAAPAPLLELDLEGSVQAVSADDQRVALANWTHIQVRRAEDLYLLGARKNLAWTDYEQNFGIALDGPRMYVAEWEGMYVVEHREGYAAPDLWIGESMFDFWGDVGWSETVQVLNRGPLPLELSELEVSSPEILSVSPGSLSVEPGHVSALTLTWSPPAGDENEHALRAATNDPELGDLEIPIYTSTGDKLNVGDALTEDFAFLDPTGADDLANLEGRVVVLAYFAVF